MGDEGITRRSLLRGRLVRVPEPTPSRPITHEGRELPAVISWLDPAMRATPHRGTTEASFALLRPPGAVAEPDFLSACTRCGDCASACPHDAIRPGPPRLRDAEGTPVIDPDLAACAMCEDFPCIASCETGALRPEAPAALGSAHISALDCLNRNSTSCSVCVERCPVDALAFAGDTPAVNDALCTGCGLCQHVCPAPQNAVAMLPNPDRPTTAALDALDALAREDAPLDLPALHEGELDDAGLRALFRDLSACTEVDGIRLKQAAREHAAPGAPSLEEALLALLAGRARGAQIHYRYQDEAWCDTVLRQPKGYRVVRIARPQRPTQSPDAGDRAPLSETGDG